MSHFDEAILVVLAHEGGYGNVTGDPGGETKFGICRRSYPDLDIKGLTRDQAIAIYRRDYWLPAYDRINDRAIAAKLFDMAVNMGSFQAHSIIQRAVSANEDGVIGPQTLTLINAANPLELLTRLKNEQSRFYRTLAVRNPAAGKFLNGWLARAAWPHDPEVMA